MHAVISRSADARRDIEERRCTPWCLVCLSRQAHQSRDAAFDVDMCHHLLVSCRSHTGAAAALSPWGGPI
jgi:hypothetical protein